MSMRIPPTASTFLFLTLAICIAGCNQNRAGGPPAAAPIPVISQQPEFEPNPPVSEPQRNVALPPPQPVPPEALPRTTGPLTVEVKPESETDVLTESRAAAIAPAVTPELSEESGEFPPLPRLGRIVTEEERTERNEAIDFNLARTAESLRTIRNSEAELDLEQRTGVKRIQAFVSQVEQTRQNDLASALNLAERAKLLAEDLARNLR